MVVSLSGGDGAHVAKDPIKQQAEKASGQVGVLLQLVMHRCNADLNRTPMRVARDRRQMQFATDCALRAIAALSAIGEQQ